MPILSEDVKLLESERLTDNPDGGGRITGNEVTDGQSNNLFPDVSDLDRTYGRVNMRKTFAGVETDDTAVYYGGHMIVQDNPDDPDVAVTMFTTDSPTDERSDARQVVESYVVKGPITRMRLLEDQLVGQRAIIAYQDVDAPLPDVGSVLCLSTESGTHDGEDQYVRVTDVASEVRTFTDTQGDFDKAVITLGIGNALIYRFYGQAAQPGLRQSAHDAVAGYHRGRCRQILRHPETDRAGGAGRSDDQA